MYSEIKLPVKYPPLTTFTGYAAALAILLTHKASYDWVFSHYLQTYVIDVVNRNENINNENYDRQLRVPFTACFLGDFDNRRLANSVDDYFFLRREGCPYFDIFEIPNDMLDIYESSFSTFVKKMIDMSMYVFLYVDVSKINEYNITIPASHEILIYGYNDEKKEIYYGDFPNNPVNKYKFSTCSYEEIDTAYKNVVNLFVPPVKSVSIIRYNDFQGKYEYKYVQDTIREYIYPDRKKADGFREYTITNFTWVNWKTRVHIGVDVYTYLSEFCDVELAAGIKNIDYRLYHAMYDHKEMMLLRFDYLLQRGWIGEEKTPLISRYACVRDNMLSIRNMIIKFNRKPDQGMITQLQELLLETKELEITLLKQIFDVE